tara:strand:+ start:4637 stop:6643 length:2007 start_codon:yes stop_codon:yes gene_type:complete
MGIKTLFLDENGEYFNQFSKNRPPSPSIDEDQLLFHPIGGRPENSFNADDEEKIEIGDPNSLLRGGASFNLKRRDDDWIRLSNFYSTPTGKRFKLRQTSLQFMNPRVDSPQKGLGDVLAGQLGSLTFGLFGLPDPNQWVYNGGINTLLSSVTAGITAMPRAGLVPGQHYGYDDVTKKSLWQTTDKENDKYIDSLTSQTNNRLVFLQKNKISDSDQGSLGLLGGLGAPGTVLGDVLGFLTGNGEELFSYLGGPKSILGIGRTTHFRYTNSTIDNYANNFLGPGAIRDQMIKTNEAKDLWFSTRPMNYLIGTGASYFDYSKVITQEDEHRTYHRESRVGLGDPGRKLTPTDKIKSKSQTGEWKYSYFMPDKIDKINALDVYSDKGTGTFTGFSHRDMIRFRFEAIDNDTPKTDNMHSDVLVFRAFLDDVSDSFSAKHNTFEYNGRAEEFYSYKGFKRDISLSFKIAAQSRHEMMPLYRKLNFLISNTAPDYSSQGRMRTPYMRMTVGHWMNRIPGVLNKVNLKWDKDYPWEINIDGPEETEGAQMLVLPHVLDVSISFTPIHNFLPQKGVSTPFILPQAIDGALSKYQQWLFDHKGLSDTISKVGKSQKNQTSKRLEETEVDVEEFNDLGAVDDIARKKQAYAIEAKREFDFNNPTQMFDGVEVDPPADG